MDITSVSLPSSLERIEDQAFRITGLTSVAIPASVSYIGYLAFATSTITNVSIAPGTQLLEIGSTAFQSVSISSITFPARVDMLNASAFDQSPLTTMRFQGNAPTIVKGYYEGDNGLLVYSPNVRMLITTGATGFNLAAWDGLNVISPPTSIPTGLSAIKGIGQLSISFNAGTNNGGAITNYKYSLDEGVTYSAFNPAVTTSPVVVKNLLGNSYTILIRATNEAGDGPASVSVTETPDPPVAISVAAIGGVTAPGTGAVAVTAVSTGNGYTGTISWSPSLVNSRFSGSTVYTATIAMTPVSGYTFSGVNSNFFTVSGANSVTNSLNSGVVTAVFPSTGPAPCYVVEDGVLTDGSACAGDVVIDDGIDAIGDVAFYGNSALTSIVIPASVESIGDQAFQNNIALASVTLSNGLDNIGDGAFRGCSSLTVLQIPNSVSSIGNAPFEDASSLTYVNVPDTVTSIDSSFIFGARSLESIHIGNGVSEISESMFYSLTKLREITVSELNSEYSAASGVLFDKDKIRLIQYPRAKTSTSYVIPASVEEVREEAFDYATKLASISIPASVTSMGASPFYGAVSLQTINVDNDNDDFSELSGVLFNKDKTTLILYPPARPNPIYRIPTGVETLLNDTFGNLSKLRTLQIPASVTSIGNNYFFRNASSLRAIEVDSDNANFADLDGVLINKIQRRLLHYPISRVGSTYTTPATILGIQEYAFVGVKSLTSLVISDDVEEIAASSVTSMPSLVSLTIGNGVNTIESNSFPNNPVLSTISIGNNVTTISDNAFVSLSSLTSVLIGNSVTTIGYMAFSDTSLNNLIIPNSVQTIGDYAFQNNVSLTSVSIGNSVTSIGDGAFRYTPLATLEIPASVTSIGSSAFAYIPSLRTVTFRSCFSGIENLSVNNHFQGSPNVEFVYSGSACTFGGGIETVTQATPSGILSLPTIFFPGTRYGSSSTRTVTVKNVGTAGFDSISPLGLDEDYLQDYSFVTNCGNQALTVNATCQLTVTFTPVEENVDEYENAIGYLSWPGYPGGSSIQQRLVGQVVEPDPSNNYSIDTSAGDNGTISQFVPSTISEGSNVLVTISPDSGYQIATVRVDSVNVSLSQLATITGQTKSYTFSSVVTDHTIEVTFTTYVAAPPVAAPVVVAPTPVPYLKSLTAPKMNLKDGKLMCSAGTYNAGFTLSGVIQGSATALFSPTGYTYNLLINGVIQTSFAVTTTSSSTSWNPTVSTPRSVYSCSVTVSSNSITTIDKSTDNTSGVNSALATQTRAILDAEVTYKVALKANALAYPKALKDNRAQWTKEIAAIRANYYLTLNRIKANAGSKMITDATTAFNVMTAAKAKSNAAYAASKPAAIAARDASNKAALDAKSLAIAKAKADYGTYIESIGYGVLIP